MRDELFRSSAFARLLRAFTTLTMVRHHGQSLLHDLMLVRACSWSVVRSPCCCTRSQHSSKEKWERKGWDGGASLCWLLVAGLTAYA